MELLPVQASMGPVAVVVVVVVQPARAVIHCGRQMV
jgi:hypothetical protein